MPRRVLSLASLVLAALALPVSAAEISGVVTNATSGEPVPGQFVSLLALRGMMVPVRETQTDERGRYKFVVAAAPGERFLVQVPFRGVNYNAAAGFTTGERITANIQVFESGASPAEIKLDAHTIFLEPHRDHLRVTEFFSVHNHSRPPRSYAPEGGSFRFAVPDTIGDLSVSVSTAGGMPLRQQPQPAGGKNTFSIDYALRPGPTEVEVSYVLPLRENRAALNLPLLTPTERRHLAVPRTGVSLTSRELEEIEQSKVPQARVYRVRTKAPGQFELELKIDPAALEAAALTAPSAPAASASESAVQIIPHPVNRTQWTIVGLSLVILSFGLYYLYRFGSSPAGEASAPHQASQTASDPDQRASLEVRDLERQGVD